MSVLDYVFNVRGEQIPADHSFALFSAIDNLVAGLHGEKGVGIFPINGIVAGNRMLRLSNRSRLTVRAHAERMKDFLAIGGKQLAIGANSLLIGAPQARSLIPAARLFSRLVIIKGYTEPEAFLGAVQRQLHEMGVKGRPSLAIKKSSDNGKKQPGVASVPAYLRRTVCIHGKNVVGFGMYVSELTAEESLIVQERGVGGRRRFGCGLFVPAQ
jgi:CRISPR-associated protein Cas6